MKRLLLLAVFLVSTVISLQAQNKTGILYMSTPASYEVKNISRNGQWACGTKYDSDKECSYGFRWNLLTDNIEMLGGVCQANGIADDGTVAGSYYTDEVYPDRDAIEVPALWQDGKWTILEMPNAYGSWASAISPDGRYVTGGDNKYTSYVWTDGKITTRIPVTVQGGCNMSYSIAPDGSKIGGWSYVHGDNSRNAGYWTVSDKQFHELEPDIEGQPWQAVKRFSTDGNKMLYWGGYHGDDEAGWGLHAIYDAVKDEKTTIYPIDPDPFNIDFYDMNGDATIVTGYEENGDGEQYGFVWHDGQTELVESYLEGRGADFSSLDLMGAAVQEYSLIGVPGVDSEAKTFAILYYDNSYNYHTLVVAFDRDMTMTPPNNLVATQVAGLATVRLSWDEPLGDKSTLKGYNIYRNGEKITSGPVAETTYYDTNLNGTTFDYKVTAQYEEGESAKGSEANVTLVVGQTKAPISLLSRQKGYNSALAMWNAPESNLPSLNYYGNETTALDGFGGASVSFESGTLFPADLMSLYDGYSIAGVTFFPASEQDSWVVSIYTHKDGALTCLYTQEVDQELNYGVKNTVRFPEPLKLENGQDLLVGIQTNVCNSSYDVQKVYEDCLKIGYTDLIRQVGEDDFYSINAMSGGGSWDVAWATGVLMAAEGTPDDIDDIDHYTVYMNDESTTTRDTRYVAKALADGSYSMAVDVVYADGRRSEKVEAALAIKANISALAAVTPKVKASMADNIMNASWDAPKDDDPTALAYCGTTPASVSPMANADVSAFAARVDFLPADLRSFDGYEIKSLDYYPVSSSNFELQVYQGDEMLADIPVESYDAGEWNTVQLEEPITIDPTKTYSYIIYCSECPADEAPLAIDNESTVDNASLLMVDGASEWSTIEDESYLSGNWLMRMNVAEKDADPLEVSSYDVYVDNSSVGTTPDCNYSYAMQNTEGVHTVRVDAHYVLSGATVKGNRVYFQFDDPAGINEVKSDDVKSGAMYNLAGQRISHAVKGIFIKQGKKFVK